MILIDHFENFISQNFTFNFLTKIKSLNKKKAFSLKEKIINSTIIHWIGDTSKAMKIVNTDIINLSYLDDLSEQQLIKFIRETHLLNYWGAYSIAIKRYNYLINSNLTTKTDKKYPQFYNSLGNHYLQTFQYKKAYNIFKNHSSFFIKGTSSYFFNVISQADCKSGMGKYQEALNIVTKLDSLSKKNPMFRSIYLQVIGEYKLKNAKTDEALKYLKTSKSIFESNNISNKDYAYCLVNLGTIYCINNEQEKAITYFEKAENIFRKGSSSILPLLELAYLYNHFKIHNTRFKILHNFYPVTFKSTYTKLIKIKADNIRNAQTSIDSRLPLIDNSPSNFDENVIDLEQGLIKNSGKTHILNILQLRLLSIITSCNDFGCFEGVLLNHVYDDCIYNSLECDKLKKLIKRIKNYGIKIKSKDKFYYIENLEEFSITYKKLAI